MLNSAYKEGLPMKKIGTVKYLPFGIRLIHGLELNNEDCNVEEEDVELKMPSISFNIRVLQK